MHRAEEEVKEEGEEESGGKNETDLEDFVTPAVDTIRSPSENLSSEMELSEWEADNFSEGCNMERRETWQLGFNVFRWEEAPAAAEGKKLVNIDSKSSDSADASDIKMCSHMSFRAIIFPSQPPV